MRIALFGRAQHNDSNFTVHILPLVIVAVQRIGLDTELQVHDRRLHTGLIGAGRERVEFFVEGKGMHLIFERGVEGCAATGQAQFHDIETLEPSVIAHRTQLQVGEAF